MTKEVVNKLEEGFSMGYNDEEACLWADISPRTLYNYCRENPEFGIKKEVLKRKPKMIAKRTIMSGMADDTKLAMDYLKSSDKEFQPKQNVDHSGEVKINITHYTTQGEEIK
jgi:hypothetical protein